MKFIFATALAVVTGLIVTPSAKAELLFLGKASSGLTIKLDTRTVARNVSSFSGWTGFTYLLGGRRIAAEANGRTGQWEADGKTHTPQSQATRDMISIVCSAKSLDEEDPMGDYVAYLVYDPPSNVRTQPNGSVKCSLTGKIVILAYIEPQDNWYLTQACGGGWIHKSQLRRFD